MQQAFMCSVNMIMPLLLDSNRERTYTFLHQDEYIFKSIQCCLASCANVTKNFLHLSHHYANTSPWKWKKRPKRFEIKTIKSVDYKQKWTFNTAVPKIRFKCEVWIVKMCNYNELWKWMYAKMKIIFSIKIWNKLKLR